MRSHTLASGPAVCLSSGTFRSTAAAALLGLTVWAGGAYMSVHAATVNTAQPAAAVSSTSPVATPSQQSALALDGRTLTLAQVVAVARDGQSVAPTQEALRRVDRSHALLLEYARLGQPVYGLNRGVGQNKDQTIFSGDTISAEARQLSEAFNHRMLLSHTVAYGQTAPGDAVRAAMVIRLNTALFGGTGMSRALVDQYIAFLNKGLTPVVLGEGSVGEADITILPQIGLAMMGEGEIELDGKVMRAADALRQAGVQPVKPYAKDSLSILSSNAYGAALAILAAHDVTQILDRADEVVALSLEGMDGNVAPFLGVTQAQRPYAGQQQTAARLVELLRGSALWQKNDSRGLQDPLSFRTASQVHGAVRDMLDMLHAQLAIQINSSDDNPTVALDVAAPKDAPPQERRYYVTEGDVKGAIVPSAGFDPLAWALPLQSVSVGLSHVAQSSAQRILRMGDPTFSRLPRFLSPDDRTLAYTTIQKPVSVLVTEIRSLSHPVSSDALVMAGHIEDVGTNAPVTAQRLYKQVAYLRTLLGIELIHAAQAVDLRMRAEPQRTLGAGTQPLLKDFREYVAFLSADRRLATDIAQADRFLQKARPLNK